VRRDHDGGPALCYLLAEEAHLLVPLLVRHATVNPRNLPGEAQGLKTHDQELQGIPMLGEDEELFALERGIAHEATQLLEFGLVPLLVNAPGQVYQRRDLAALLLQIYE